MAQVFSVGGTVDADSFTGLAVADLLNQLILTIDGELVYDENGDLLTLTA